MDGAALLMLITGVGVGFGWQPMPDGSQRYEYVVQVDPELAATLARGQSIPIVSDIPSEVQPIGRIRLVVGREEPPRQRLITHLKPASDPAAAASGVALAQYNRYGEQQSTPAGAQNAAHAANPYTQTPDKQEPATSWNAQPDQSITPTDTSPPSSQQLFGQSPASTESWNGVTPQSVADAAAAPLSRVGNELQRAVEPLRNGLEKVDNQVRGAVDNLGDRTRTIVDELRQPFNPQPQLPAESRQGAASSANSQDQSWNQQSAAPTQNPLRDNAAQAGANWNDRPQAPSQTSPPAYTPPVAATQSGASPSAVASAAEGEWNSSPGAASSANVQDGTTSDPWAGVPDPRSGSVANQPGNLADVAGLATRPMPFGGVAGASQTAGPQFPPGDSQPQAQPSGTTINGARNAAPSAPAVVGSNLLRQPADRPLDGTRAGPTMSGASAASPQASQRAETASPWGGATQTPGATTAAPSPTASAASPGVSQATGRDNTVTVLVAWVLLTGSIAGNMYLFWSYLDVRQKYRSLVRKTARAVGSRFSAA